MELVAASGILQENLGGRYRVRERPDGITLAPLGQIVYLAIG